MYLVFLGNTWRRLLCHANRDGSTGQFVMQMEDCLCFTDKHRCVFCAVRQRQLRKSTSDVGILTPNTQLPFQKNKKICKLRWQQNVFGEKHCS